MSDPKKPNPDKTPTWDEELEAYRAKEWGEIERPNGHEENDLAFAQRLEREHAEEFKARKEGKPPPKKKKRSSTEATELNIWKALRTEPELHEGELFKLDTFSGQTLLMHPIPLPGIDLPKQWKARDTNDVDVSHLLVWLQANNFVKASVGRCGHAIDMEADHNKFSSAKQWLLGLPKWDGTVRLDHFFDEVCGAKEAEDDEHEDSIYRSTRYLAAIGRCFFISIVARVMSPGCQVDTVVVLESDEGASKTNLLRTLAVRREWFSDSMPGNLKDKDAMQHLPGKLIIELAELEQLKGTRDFSTIKKFLTRLEDVYRRSYGKREIHQPRQCVFVGTTNQTDYMPDEGGTRRFWPVHCSARIDLDKAKAWLPQLYAEALVAFLADEPWHLGREVEEIAKGIRSKRSVEDVWDEVIEGIAGAAEAEAKGKGESYAHTTVRECLNSIDPDLLKSERKGSEMRVAKLLIKHGFYKRAQWSKDAGLVRIWWRKVPKRP